MRVLLTGGNGFLGSNLTKHLVKAGNEVMVISRSWGRLTDVIQSITFVQHSSPGLEEKVLAFSPTVVIHTAWDGGNTYANINSTNQARNISYGCDLLDMIAKISPTPRFIGLGSFSEYGRMTSPATESQACSPINVYGFSKLCFKDISEIICEGKIPWSWVRPCYIYGQNDVKTRLVPTMIRKFVANETLTVDSCTSVVDFLHVDDFCTGIDAIIAANQNGVYNICSGTEIRVRDLIEKIRIISNTSSTVVFDPKLDRVKLSTYACGNPSKLKMIGWSQTVSLDEGLQRLIADEKLGHYIDNDGLHSEN